MAEFKNLHLLPDGFQQSEIERMEYAAIEHKRHNAITFKIIEYTPKKITIQVTQGRNAAKVYHNAKRLSEIVHETFDRFFPGMKIIVHTIPFVDTPVSKVDIAWINKQMLTSGVKLKTMADESGLNYTYLSSMVNGNEPLSQLMKAFFWYYFQSK